MKETQEIEFSFSNFEIWRRLIFKKKKVEYWRTCFEIKWLGFPIFNCPISSNSVKSRAIPRNSEQFRAIPCYSALFQAIPRNSEQLWAIPSNSVQFYNSAIPCNSAIPQFRAISHYEIPIVNLIKMLKKLIPWFTLLFSNHYILIYKPISDQ